jgi:hypothetical protein
MSNLLAMPLVTMTIETGNNEDWIDSIKFLVDDGTLSPPQLDIRGITFDMEIRRALADHEVILAASTTNGTLIIGQPPDFGFLIISVPIAEMQNLAAQDYVGDIVGHDELYKRTVIKISTLTIFEGVTKQPVNQRIVVEVAA